MYPLFRHTCNYLYSSEGGQGQLSCTYLSMCLRWQSTINDKYHWNYDTARWIASITMQLVGITSPCCLLIASHDVIALQFLWWKMLWNHHAACWLHHTIFLPSTFCEKMLWNLPILPWFDINWLYRYTVCPQFPTCMVQGPSLPLFGPGIKARVGDGKVVFLFMHHKLAMKQWNLLFYAL